MTLGVVSQRRFFEPCLRVKAAIDAGKIGRPALGVFSMFSWRDPAIMHVRPLARPMGHRGGRRPGQPVAASARPAPMVHRRSRRDFGRLGQPQSPLGRGRRHAVATVRFAGGALGSIVTSLSQKSRPLDQGPCPRDDRALRSASRPIAARTFVAGVSRRSPSRRLERPLDDPRRGAQARRIPRPRTAPGSPPIDATSHYHALQISDFLRDPRRPPAPRHRPRTAARSWRCSPPSTDPTAKAGRFRLPAPGRGRRRPALIGDRPRDGRARRLGL